MIGVNKVNLIGNIGLINGYDEYEKSFTIKIATTESYKSANGENKLDTQWHVVRFTKSMLDLKNTLSKGDLVYIEGRLSYKKHEENVYTSEIIAKNIRVLKRKFDSIISD